MAGELTAMHDRVCTLIVGAELLRAPNVGAGGCTEGTSRSGPAGAVCSSSRDRRVGKTAAPRHTPGTAIEIPVHQAWPGGCRGGVRTSALPSGLREERLKHPARAAGLALGTCGRAAGVLVYPLHHREPPAALLTPVVVARHRRTLPSHVRRSSPPYPDGHSATSDRAPVFCAEAGTRASRARLRPRDEGPCALAGPAGSTSATAAVRCKGKRGNPGGASVQPPFGGTSVAAASGPAATERQCPLGGILGVPV
jgi:hypothetical protein